MTQNVSRQNLEDASDVRAGPVAFINRLIFRAQRTGLPGDSNESQGGQFVPPGEIQPTAATINEGELVAALRLLSLGILGLSPPVGYNAMPAGEREELLALYLQLLVMYTNTDYLRKPCDEK